MNHTFQNLSIFCTTRCNLRCPLCACRDLMDRVPGYDMGLDELRHFVARCEELQLHFAWAWFTGGEPTLWPNLVEGVRILAGSACFGKLRINTNGAAIEQLEPVIDLLANVRMSVYKSNAKRAAELAPVREQYKLGFWSEPHRKLPDGPVPNSLPGACICPIPGYFLGRVYVCPGAYGNLPRMGHRLDNPELSCHVDDDFATYYRQRMDTRFYSDCCQWCISNGIVYAAARPTQEDPVDVPGADLSRGRMDS